MAWHSHPPCFAMLYSVSLQSYTPHRFIANPPYPTLPYSSMPYVIHASYHTPIPPTLPPSLSYILSIALPY